MPIGRPIANTQLYVLDAWFQPVPIGVPGELYIGGSALARGYTHPDLTAERFLPHPFSTEPGARLYRTGDRVWYRADGTLQYLGRIDQQVKLRGFRIELGEIEAALLAYPAIREAVVVVRDDPPIGKQLVAYLVGHPEQPLIIDKIHAFLQGRLPSYMLPGAWVCLDVLPLTLNGKVDRHALPAPAEQPEAEGQAREGAQTPLEELVLGTWSAVLGRQQVGRHDNFFALGGHSLLATQLMTRLRTIFNIELPLRTVFETPTVAGLAHTIEQRLTQEHTLSVPPLLAGTRPLQLPLSFAQQRLWFLDQLEPGNAAYLVPSALRVQGEANIRYLEESFQSLISRHESLRTTFAEHDGQPLQVIHATRPVQLPVIDLQGLDPERREREAHYLAEQEAQRSCDLTQGPLLRTSILRLEREEHILLLTLHHIITDGWSNDVLVRELLTFYRSFAAGQTSSPLPPLSLQYADYTLWQRQWLQGEALDAQLAYWREQLAGVSPLELPTDHARPVMQRYRGANLTWQLPVTLSEDLQALSREQDVTLFMLLLASFQVLLMRYSGQSDISVGTPIANRQHEEIEGVIGFFVNTLVLRTDLSGDPTFAQVLQRVREVCLGAYAHQDLPFEKVVEELAPERDLSRSPLFQVMLTMQNVPEDQGTLAGLSMSPLEVEQLVSKFDLTLSIAEIGHLLCGTLTYNTDLFAVETVTRLLNHWQALLVSILHDPQTRVWALPLLSQKEHDQTVRQWNETQQDYPQHSVHHLFEQQARQTPDMVALVFEEQMLTYGELNQRANQLAHYLQQQGAGPEVLVAICLERSLEMVVGILAVLKTGSAYVPLDPTLPQQRLAYMLEDAQISFVLTQSHLQNHPTLQERKLFCIDTKDFSQKAEFTTNLDIALQPDNLVYMIYTSGSTGQPKGVMNTQHGLLNRLAWMQQIYQLTDHDRVLHKTPFSFDVSVWEFFWPLITGAQLIVAQPGGHQDPAYLKQLIIQQHVTTIHFVPSMLQAFLFEPTTLRDCTSLRQVMCSGEALSAELQARFFALAPHHMLLSNLYGPTEASIDVTYWHCQRNDTRAIVPIGTPIANTQMYVLDTQMRPVPIGVTGELYIGGIGLARGYFDRPDLTAERFLPSPFGSQGERIYRTGDLARHRVDGTIEYLGRIDFQVKVRGFRIELGEIEAIVGSHPDVQDTVVLAREDIPGEKRLVAYVVGRQAATLTSKDMRSYAQERLPAYMIPAMFVFLPSLPLTPHGKLDQRALPLPQWEQRQADDNFLAPHNELEKALTTIWEEVLQVPQIGIRDNFFERGGDSILGIQLVARTRQQGLSLTLKQLFHYQTIEQLSTVVHSETFMPIEHHPAEGSVPLTPIQHWFFDLELVHARHWNQALLLETATHLKPSLLEEAIGACIKQHDAFRLRFTHTDEKWQQAFSEFADAIPFTHMDLTDLAVAEQDATITCLAEQTQASLDLDHGPLMHVVLFSRGEHRRQLLLLVIHHLVIDGVSWRILLDDLQTAYQQRVQRQAIQLPGRTSSFQAWSQRLLAYAQSNTLQQERQYWLTQARKQVYSLPCEVSQDALDNTVATAQVFSAALDSEETRALLEELPSIYHTQINEILLAALALTLRQWTQASTILIDLEGHGREELFEDIDLSRTIGWFTTRFPVHLQIGEASDIAETITAVKEQLRSIPQHGIGYGLLRYLSMDTELVAQLAAQPQPEISFNYLGQLDQQRLSSLITGASPLSSGSAQSPLDKRAYLLDIICQVSDHQLHVSWEYCTQAHHQATIEQLSNGFLDALRAIIQQSTLPGAGSYSSSDFPHVPLRQEDLTQILATMAPETRMIEAINLVTPLQQGMLYETIRNPGSGIHIEQSLSTLMGPLDVATFERAWQWGVQRHDILRTGFIWHTQSEPLQITLPHVSLSLDYQDLSDLARDEQSLFVENVLRQQRMEGFDLIHPPLMHVTLFCLEEQTYRFLWTYHHLIMDGWSQQVLLSEIVARYASLRQEQPLAVSPAHPYREYLTWLQQQDRSQAEVFWQTTLRGFTQPTPLGRVQPVTQSHVQGDERSASAYLSLPASFSNALQRVTQSHRLTLSTLLQGAWALLLQRYSNTEDIVFGITVSGRPAELPGVETMVGPCINTLPLRVQVPLSRSLWSWLEDLQTHTLEMHAFEYSPAGQIHRWSDVPGKSLLYESLLVVENYPISTEDAWAEHQIGFTVGETLTKGAQTKYALTFLVGRDSILCIYDSARFTLPIVEQILSHFQAVLTAMMNDATDVTLATLSALIPEEQIPLVSMPTTELQTPPDADERMPRSPLEEVVAGVWCEVLGLDQIGRESNFFALGGHSLIATQVIGRLRAMLTIEVPLSVMFEYQTVAEMARWIEQTGRAGVALPPLSAGERPQDLLLSFAQRRLWFLDQLEPDNTAYLVPNTLLIHGAIDVPALEESLQVLVQRHESLRTTFTEHNGQPVQIIHANGQVWLPVIDLQGLDPERREQEARHLAEQETQRPCDLVKGPLLRTTVLRLEQEAHVLLLTLHHIITDGWSNNILIREMSMLYGSFAAGQSSPLPPLPLQYADYALWQRQWLQGKALETQVSYWREQLAGITPLDLPTDHPRPVVQSYRGASLAWQLPAAISTELQEFSRQQDVTLFMTLLASFQILLMRYSRQNDISVGTPIANRQHADIEGVIGFFINTLVLRTDLSAHPTFIQVLQRVREVCLGAYAHQDLPFEYVVDALEPVRDLSRSPLFQVLFVLQNTPHEQHEVAGIQMSPLEISHLVSMYDLTLSVVEDSQGLHGILEYNTDLFEAETMQHLIDHWQTLLQALLATPESPIGTHSLLTEDEQAQVLAISTGTVRPAFQEQYVHVLFEEQVARTPDAVALVFQEQCLTYEELNRRANQFAHHLQKLGVRPDVLVALCLERSLAMPLAVLAVLKAGGAYLPLDPGAPSQRQILLLTQAQPALLLTQQHLEALFTETSCPTLLVEDLESRVFHGPANTPQLDLSLDHLAYLIATSGSTGVPKGVQVTQRGLGNLAQAQAQAFAVAPGSRVLQFAALTFDASISELLMALLMGACLHLAPTTDLMPGPDLLQLLREQAITVVTLPPSALAVLPSTPLPDLQTLVVAGEPCPVEVMTHWAQGRGFFNAYGPTEATVCASIADYSLVPVPQRSLSLGEPLSNTELYLLDENQQLVPTGLVGEIYLGGPGLARGYLHQSGQTAERFIPHPWSLEPGARLYRTGDLARWQFDGRLEYLGRADQQVKLRGYRIELGEIEAVLRQHETIRDIAVVVRDEPPTGKRLVSYVVGQPGLRVSFSELRDFLQQRLPSYMLPSAWVALDALPLTPNGKIDRRALPAPDEVREVETVDEAQTPLDELLIGVWSALLGRQQVGRHDNFFALGGHSLLAAQLVTRLRTLFKIELPLRAVFANPTVAGLAQQVEQYIRQAQALPMSPLLAGPRPQELPLSFAQQRLWFLDQLEPGSAAYLVPSALLVQGALDISGVEKSLQALMQRHESLRTTFTEQHGKPVQVIHTTGQIWLPLIDLQELDPEQREQEARHLAEQEARQSCDLTQGPLLRTVVVRMEPQTHVLLLTLHHIITDGWSNGILVRELTILYRSFAAGQSSPLPPLPIQYADYALWQRQWLQGEALATQMAYWREQLAGAPPLDLPTDHPRPAIQTLRGRNQAWQFSPTLSAQLQELSRQQDVTLFMLLLASFQVLLMRYNGQHDISVGTPIANRQQAEIEGVIGFFVNTLVLRTDLSGHPTFAQVLQRVREVCLGAYAHQDLPFEKVVEEIAPERDQSRSPLFQVMLALQNTPREQETLAGVHMYPLEVEHAVSKFDLTLFAEETEQVLHGILQYNTDLFEAETITRMLGHWQNLLEEVVQNPHVSVGEVSLLSATEQVQVLEQWNATRYEYPQQGIHHLFERQALQNPDVVALVFEEQMLTYGELNRRANQLAHYLQKQGVRPEVVVGISMERCSEIAVGVLAILKAGGTYMPIDPSYPQQRLNYMLQDAHLTWLLTQKSLLPTFEGLTPDVQRAYIYLDQPPAELYQQPDSNPASFMTRDQLAYVIYTSGSTGRPKGIMLPHQALLNLFIWQAHDLPLQRGTRVLQFAPLSFDVSCQEMFTTWQGGGTLVVLPDDELRRDPDAVLQLLARQQIERIFVPYVALQQLALAAEQQVNVPLALHSIITAGEQLQITQSIATWMQRLPESSLYNHYGPSESHVVTSYMLQDDPQRWATLPPIGRPINNTQIYVLDADMQPMPVGIAGELYIGGHNLARGYLARPELTAERFVAHPFAQEPGSRLYKTGDLARYRSDGNIEFLGRIDQQVKLRGFRVEPGEIEAVLTSHPSIKDSIVIVHKEHATASHLTAYVVPQTDQDLDVNEVHRFARGQLPEYMVPTFIISLPVFPLTPSGKIDRRSLPRPEQDMQFVDEVRMTPQTPIQELVASHWHEVLQRSMISIDANFFDLGGHSLLATQIIGRLRQSFQIDLPVRSLFQFPTIRGLALEVEQLQRGSVAQSMPSLVPGDRRKPLALSFAQERFWLLEQLDRKSGIYMPAILRLYGHVEVEALQHSFEALIQRHEILRTTFTSYQGQPVQIVASAGVTSLPVIDLSELSEERRESLLQQLLQQEVHQTFDLVNGPLLHMTLLRLAEQDHVLLLTLHHILSDGWSEGLLVRDLTALYRSEITGEPALLPALPIQYADYALWQRQWFKEAVLQEQMNYWQQQLMGIPEFLDLPLDHPRPALQTYAGRRIYRQLPNTLTDKLKQLSRRENATLFMTLLASWQILLMRYSGQQDFATGTFIANRTRPELENLIGVFVNTLVLRANLTGNPSFQQLLNRVRKVALDAYAHQDVPFEKLLDTLPIERSLSHSALFQVLFTLQNYPHTPLELPGLSWKLLGREIQQARFDLIIEASENNDGLMVSLEYNTDLFEDSTVQRMLTHWQVLLEAIVEDPEQRIEQLPLMTPPEVLAQLTQTRRTAIQKFSADSIQQIFEYQVEQAPDAIAIIIEEIALTYGALNRRANQLAHYLRGQGVGPDIFVGVAMERCSDLIVAMLAILKAGGAYVPLDPSYPIERLALMLEEVDPLVVLTQSHIEPNIAAHTTQCLSLDTVWERWSGEPSSNPPTWTLPQHIAYMIYTSGSTGKPKGVMIPHANVVRLITQTQDYFHFTQQDTWTFFHSYAFDFSVWEIWGSLLTGGRMIIVPYWLSREPGKFYQLLCQEGITILNQTPSAFQQLMHVEARETPSSLLALRTIIFGGEALDVSRLAPWITRHGDQHPQLINMYGITETTVHVTYRPIVQQDSSENAGSVIGSTIPDLDGYVLDKHQQLVPIGVPGELYVGGQGLARGYWQRPDSTAERFIPHPFSALPGERLYRTGDRVRALASGELEYLGRNDQQVKLRGFRIELGEIAAVLQKLAAIREALVVLRTENNEHHYLVAYVIPQNRDDTLTIPQIQAHTRIHLPEYMVPTYIVFLEAWPLTLNGKVNYQALPVPNEQHLSHRTQYMAPQTPLQEELALMWADLLHTSQVGIHDHFFDIGGNSLLAVQLLDRMHQRLGTSLSFVSLFNASTIEQQAELLQSQTQHRRSWTPLVAIQQTGHKAPFFCVHPVIGTVYSYVRLAHLLRDDRPFYGLQAYGFYSDQTPYTTIEEMATSYVEALLAVQPEGPYYLGGHSSGGMIAYEMARQLQSRGAEIALLALLDSVPWQDPRSGNTPLSLTVPDKKIHAGAVIEYLNLFSGYRDQSIALTYEQLCDLQPEEQLKTLLEQLKAANLLAQSMSMDEFLHFMQVLITNNESYQHYQPGRYQGQITLLHCEQTSDDYQTQWAPFITQPIDEHVVPGNHFSMLTEPHVAILAAQLQRCLDETDTHS
ncbi:hypothetical protein KDI_33890 [Dictyobacter arantiisoli]|uniref:Carrier domain-containing protein n=1 Tax=Dictyobacter arantiisoli TaxID=2014874 RepID=A0A5A5TF28_9CHLR|nr:non-ribosomal peptide synthetase [Dictyobacter arantiisoli]GCF09825.1 hypothetical protein KDI_33890 [Dictyobacter arantiisoli]